MSADSKLLTPRLPAWRSRALLLALLLAFVSLTARAVYLQGMNHDFYRKKGEERYTHVLKVSEHRGMITDRHGEPLAISTPMESAWLNPKEVEFAKGSLAKLARILDMRPDEIRKIASAEDRNFAYLKRRLPPEVAKAVVALGIPGVSLEREYRRYYPEAEVAAHVIGYTGVDDQGQEGIELAFDQVIAGVPGKRRVIMNRLGQIIENVGAVDDSRAGADLALSLDKRLQYLAYRELKAAVADNKAKGGGIVVLDAETGEVLALANYPSFNPNNRAQLASERSRNRAITDLFEPGSTLKSFTVAAALEAGLVNPNTLIDVSRGIYKVGAKTIRDVHPHDHLTVAEIVQKSSNVGAAKIGLALKPDQLWRTLSAAGFGEPPDSGFPGEGGGILRPHLSWRPIEQATISFGHGISVSLLQLARAYTLFASDGELKPVSLLKREHSPKSEIVISASTARAVRAMLETVALEGGTATRAQIPGYRVAGKTGTAHKIENGAYSPDKYVASFVGFAPVSRPKLVVAVMLDEPGAGDHFGGVVAAPVFSAVMAGALRLLSVPPDAPFETLLIAQERP
ncbi:MAG: peptidoglycan D,D-transpeptidase FtsI family protein [Burkholderiales bacterium]